MAQVRGTVTVEVDLDKATNGISKQGAAAGDEFGKSFQKSASKGVNKTLTDGLNGTQALKDVQKLQKEGRAQILKNAKETFKVQSTFNKARITDEQKYSKLTKSVNDFALKQTQKVAEARKKGLESFGTGKAKALLDIEKATQEAVESTAKARQKSLDAFSSGKANAQLDIEKATQAAVEKTAKIRQDSLDAYTKGQSKANAVFAKEQEKIGASLVKQAQQADRLTANTNDAQSFLNNNKTSAAIEESLAGFKDFVIDGRFEISNAAALAQIRELDGQDIDIPVDLQFSDAATLQRIRELDGERIDIEIDGDTSKLDSDLAEIERFTERKEIVIDADTSRYTSKIASLGAAIETQYGDVDADTSRYQSAIARLGTFLKNTEKVDIDADTSQAKAAIERLDGKNIKVDVDANMSNINNKIRSLQGSIDKAVGGGFQKSFGRAGSLLKGLGSQLFSQVILESLVGEGLRAALIGVGTAFASQAAIIDLPISLALDAGGLEEATVLGERITDAIYAGFNGDTSEATEFVSGLVGTIGQEATDALSALDLAALSNLGIDTTDIDEVRAALNLLEAEGAAALISLTGAAKGFAAQFQEVIAGGITTQLRPQITDFFAAFSDGAARATAAFGAIGVAITNAFGTDVGSNFGDALINGLVSTAERIASFVTDIKTALDALDFSQARAELVTFRAALAQLLGLQGIDGLGDVLIRLAEAATRLSESGNVGRVFDELLQAASAVLPVVQELKQAFADFVIPNIGGLGELIVGLLALKGLATIAPGLVLVGTAIKAIVASIAGLGASAALPIAAIIAVFVLLIATSESLRSKLAEAVGDILSFFDAIYQVFQGGGLDGIAAVLEGIGSALGDFILFSIEITKAGLFAIIAFTEGFISSVKTIADAVSQLKNLPKVLAQGFDTTNFEDPLAVTADSLIALNDATDNSRFQDFSFDLGTITPTIETDTTEIEAEVEGLNGRIDDILTGGVFGDEFSEFQLRVKYGLEEGTDTDQFFATLKAVEDKARASFEGDPVVIDRVVDIIYGNGPNDAGISDILSFLDSNLELLDQYSPDTIKLLQEVEQDVDVINDNDFQAELLAGFIEVIAGIEGLPPEEVALSILPKLEDRGDSGIDTQKVLDFLDLPEDIEEIIKVALKVSTTLESNGGQGTGDSRFGTPGGLSAISDIVPLVAPNAVRNGDGSQTVEAPVDVKVKTGEVSVDLAGIGTTDITAQVQAAFPEQIEVDIPVVVNTSISVPGTVGASSGGGGQQGVAGTVNAGGLEAQIRASFPTEIDVNLPVTITPQVSLSSGGPAADGGASVGSIAAQIEGQLVGLALTASVPIAVTPKPELVPGYSAGVAADITTAFSFIPIPVTVPVSVTVGTVTFGAGASLSALIAAKIPTIAAVTVTVTFTVTVNADLGEIDGIRDKVSALNGLTGTATVNVTGAPAAVSAVGSLKTAIDNLPASVTVPVSANVSGQAAVEGLTAAINNVPRPSAFDITAIVTGTSAVLGLATAINSLKSKSITLTTNLVTNSTTSAFGSNGEAFGATGLARGGKVTSPRLTWLGEGNRPEAVIPLTQPRRALQLLQQTGLDSLINKATALGQSPGVKLGGTPGATANTTSSTQGNFEQNIYVQTRPGQNETGVGTSMARELARLLR